MRSIAATPFITCSLLLTFGCGGDSLAPFTASPLPPNPPPATSGPVVTVSGLITTAAGTPIAADVAAYPLIFSPAWSGSWGRRSHSDDSGHYRITNVPEQSDVAYVRAWKQGYVQQCAASVAPTGDASADLTITPKEDVVITGLPTSATTRQISGTVYTTRENVRQPVAGVWVGWEPIMDTVVADTLTDAQGRYRLCGLPKDRVNSLFAVRVGTINPVYGEAVAGDDAIVDFELP